MASAIALLAVPVALGATPETPKPGQRIDMKVLLLTSATTDTTATTWEAALKREGVPYEKLVVGTAGVLTDAKLADYAANRAFYQAVIVAPGNIADPGVLPAADLAALTKFQTSFGIRQLSDNTFPNAAHGLAAPTSSGSQDGVTANLTDTGRLAFPYLKGPVTIDNVDPAVDESFGYLAQPLNAANFQTLLTGPGNAAFLGVFTHPEDGREEMVMTAGEQRVPDAQPPAAPRDAQLGHARRLPRPPAQLLRDAGRRRLHRRRRLGPGDEVTSFDEADVIRMNAADVDRAVQWSRANGLKLDIVYNGLNTDPIEVLNAFKANANEFRWISHTFTHPNLDCSTRGFIASEINQNRRRPTHGLPIDPSELVTGEHSGLANTRPGNPGTIDPPFFADEPTAAAGGTLAGRLLRLRHHRPLEQRRDDRVVHRSPRRPPARRHELGGHLPRRRLRGLPQAGRVGRRLGQGRLGRAAQPVVHRRRPGDRDVHRHGRRDERGGAAGVEHRGARPLRGEPGVRGRAERRGIRVIASDNSKDYPQATAGRLFTVDPQPAGPGARRPALPQQRLLQHRHPDQQLDEYNWIYATPAAGATASRSRGSRRAATRSRRGTTTSTARSDHVRHMMGNDPRPTTSTRPTSPRQPTPRAASCTRWWTR